MPRNSQSQWDFGELFGPKQTRRVFTVAELTGRLRALLESQMGFVWVSGEVSNLRLQSSGHMYFTLKDATTQLQCVLFRGENVSVRSTLADGVKVVLRGAITVYEPRGQYQLRVTEVELQGVGALQLAFERLKQKLNAEGLFAAARKRPIPRFAEQIGLVTSPTGAALQDILSVVERRNPSLSLVLAACRVQGEGAAAEIVGAIDTLNQWSCEEKRDRRRGLDVILLARGGGSLEDLWTFNEELVARAIAASAIPVVSGVGHEIDFTICDFTADLRAPTPSAAAEILTQGFFESRQRLPELARLLSRRVEDKVESSQSSLDGLAQRLRRVEPGRRLRDQAQHLDEMAIALDRCLRDCLERSSSRLQNLAMRWRLIRPERRLSQAEAALAADAARLNRRLEARTGLLTKVVESARQRLRLLNPRSVLERGFSITTSLDTGSILRSGEGLTPGSRLRTVLANGEVVSEVVSGSPRGS
jgi:exodeoxyribonuclease VII large subunit